VTAARGWWRQASISDLLLITVLTAIIESLVWTGKGPGDPITGPRPAAALLPLLLALPLWWRRSRPLLMCSLVMTGMIGQALISGHAAEGAYSVVAAGMASYAVAAYSPRRHALLGLAVVVVGYAAWAGSDRNTRSGHPSDLWAASFFGLYLLSAWLLGAAIQARSESAAAARRAADVKREAERAVAEERGRIARDLHDIVSHNLSVVVLQAAGGRTQADVGAVDTAATLEKIETSGRRALTEMRRLLGVLRTGDPTTEPPAALSPTPGVDDLPALVTDLREAGLDVSLEVEGDRSEVPPAVGVSLYRIVQEALTNVLKHAGDRARAEVTLRTSNQEIALDVVDDGRGPGRDRGLGHGLRGMQERVTLLGGRLVTGVRPEGGFAVSVRIPVEDPA